MAMLKQSTARSRVILMVDSTDHTTGKTGLTLTITASKDGGSFASISPTVTELATGFYKLALTSSHTDTLGDFALHITGTAADATDLVDDVIADLPGATVASVTGAVGSVTGAVGSVAGLTASDVGAIKTKTDFLPSATAGAAGGVFIAGSNAATTANITGNLTGNVSGSVGSVTGAVGSVTGNVGGNVTGSVGSVASGGIAAASFAAGAINAAAIATDAIDADALAADAVTEIQSGLSTLTAAGVRTAVGLATANLDTQLDTLPTAAENSDAVWDEVLAGHAGVGSTGAALSAAGSAGDPWSTALPGAYGAGTAGKIIGDNVNATVSSRASQTSVDDVPTNAELATALGTADDATLAAIAALNNLSAAGVRAAVGLASANLDTQLDALPTNAELATALGTADDAVLTQLALVKTVTDKLDTSVELDGAVYRFTTNALEQAPSGSGASAASIADAVWDEAIADHQSAGSTGLALNDAGAGGNPWNAVIEGSYTAEDFLRLLGAVAVGKTAIVKHGSGGATVTFRDITDASDIVVAEMSKSNRSTVTLNP